MAKWWKWRLAMILHLDKTNDTGKPQTVRGKVVPPGQRVVWESDTGYWGY